MSGSEQILLGYSRSRLSQTGRAIPILNDQPRECPNTTYLLEGMHGAVSSIRRMISTLGDILSSSPVHVAITFHSRFGSCRDISIVRIPDPKIRPCDHHFLIAM